MRWVLRRLFRLALLVLGSERNTRTYRHADMVLARLIFTGDLSTGLDVWFDRDASFFFKAR